MCTYAHVLADLHFHVLPTPHRMAHPRQDVPVSPHARLSAHLGRQSELVADAECPYAALATPAALLAAKRGHMQHSGALPRQERQLSKETSGLMRSATLRQRLIAGRARLFLAVAPLALLAAGCSTTFDGGDGPAAIPGPNPNRELPADALQPLGPVAQQQDGLWDLAYPLAIGVFLLIFGGLAYILFKFRDRGQDELPYQRHGNTKLEILWTIIPALVLVVIAIPTVQTIFALADEPAADAVLVNVVGKQYWWQFEYENEAFFTASELHIPTGREVYLTLDGSEPDNSAVYGTPPVMHSFWVPSLAGKRDYVPGALRFMRIQADEPGVYPGNCAEFCGLSHANMRFTVIAHDPEDYDAWVADQQSPAEPPQEDLVAQGEQLFVDKTCIACHGISGHPENETNEDGEEINISRVGPNLAHSAQREAFAGYIFDSPFGEQVEDPDQAMENLRGWLENPAAVKPGAQMPALGLAEDEIDALIAYLGTME
ncbi:cytochrome c oxidase subunit II [soil metagenome]